MVEVGACESSHFVFRLYTVPFYSIMKKILLFLLLLITCNVYSQAVMLFSEYQHGTVFLRNNQRVNVKLNYDATNQQMMYQQDGKKMILTNLESVSYVRIGTRKFQPLKESFCEIVPIGKKVLLVDWLIENVHLGYKGAYGQTSQARSHSVQLYSMGDYSHVVANTVSDMNVYKQKNRNVYYFYEKNKQKKFKDKKSLLKLFPHAQKQITLWIDELNTDFSKTEDIFILMEKVFLLE